MAGWLFVDAELDEGELLLFRRGANLRRGRRSVGGEVNVTDRRLLFVPNRLEQIVGSRAFSVARGDLGDVTVVKQPGSLERFKTLPGAGRARAEIDTPGELLILVLDDAEPLAQVLAQTDQPR